MFDFRTKRGHYLGKVPDMSWLKNYKQVNITGQNLHMKHANFNLVTTPLYREDSAPHVAIGEVKVTINV